MSDRYDTSGSSEGQFQPGSDLFTVFSISRYSNVPGMSVTSNIHIRVYAGFDGGGCGGVTDDCLA